MTSRSPTVPANRALPPTRRRSSPRAARRGFAVMLALVAASVATVLGMTLAATRDANLATSRNLSRAAEARAAAAGAAEVAAALLSDPSILADADGIVIDGLELGGAQVRASATDLERGGPADERSRAIELLVESSVGGVVQTARTVARLSAGDAAVAADVDCSEFAMLGTAGISVEGGASIATWRSAPLDALEDAVAIGTVSGTGISISSAANLLGTVRIVQGPFDVTEADHDESIAARVLRIPAAIHVPAPPPAPTTSGSVPTSYATSGVIGSNMSWAGSYAMPSGGACTLRNDVTVVVTGDLTYGPGTRLVVENHARIVVGGRLTLDRSAWEIAPGGSLELHCGGDVLIAASYLGPRRVDAVAAGALDGTAEYEGGAGRLALYAASGRSVAIRSATVLKGQVYGPSARIDVESRSVVYGRLLGANVRLAQGTALYYDPSLDTRRGWSTPDSGLWRDDGSLRGEVREIANLSAAELLEFTLATDVAADPPLLDVRGDAVASDPAELQLADRRASIRLDADARIRSRRAMRIANLFYAAPRWRDE